MPDDKHIIKQIRRGDVAAYSVLINRYRHMVYTLALQMVKNEADAEEIAQDAFLKAYKALNKFEGRSSFSTWIYRITYHEAISKLRKVRKNHISIEEADERSFGDNSFDDLNTDNLEASDRREFLKQALSGLRGEEANILILFYFEELKTDEIAEITGLTVANVKVKLHRGRQNLLNELNTILKRESKSLL